MQLEHNDMESTIYEVLGVTDPAKIDGHLVADHLKDGPGDKTIERGITSLRRH